MPNYREIVTKTVIGKGKKSFTTNNTVAVENEPSTILGCWVINHNFKGERTGEKVNITGSYDINIWYSYDNDTKTDVIKKTDNYNEIVKIRNDSEVINPEVIIRSLKQPSCSNVSINGKSINYTIDKELGIELVGDAKVKIDVAEGEEAWDEIIDDTDEQIEKEVKEDYIKEDNNEKIDSETI